MEPFERKLAGALVFVGGAQFLVAMIIAETLYSGYSASLNYISDLGVGPSATIFNLSISLFGLTIIATSFYIWRIFKNLLLSLLMGLAGVGAIGVGLFLKLFLRCMAFSLL